MLQNREAIDQLNKWTKAGFRLKGGKSDLGFLFCYELMTGSLPFRILHDDSPYLLACIIIRLFPAKDHQAPSVIMSVLRTMARNITLATNPSVPKISTDKQSRTVARCVFTLQVLCLLYSLRRWACCTDRYERKHPV